MRKGLTHIILQLLILITLPTHAASKLAFMVESTDGTKAIAITNDENSLEWEIHGDERMHLYPSLSADGQYLAFSAGQSASELGIYIKELASGKEYLVAPAYGRHLHADFSGDRRKLAYSHNDGQKSNISVVTLNYELGIKVTHTQNIETKGNAFFPNLSSDGRYLIFQHNVTANHKEIVRYDLQKDTSIVLTGETGLHMSPALSFDDRYVVYSKKEMGSWNLHITDILTQATHQITNTDFNELAPTFLNDGQLVFASNQGGTYELYKKDWKNSANIAVKLIHGGDTYYSPSASGEMRIQQGLHKDLLSPERSSFGAVTIGDKVYVVGGHQGPEHTYPPESFLNQLEVYDTKLNEWSRLSPRPIAAHGFDVVAHDIYLYAFGGFTYSESHTPNWKSVSQVDRYNTLTDTWETVGNLAEPRSSYSAVKVGEKVYILAGWNSTPKYIGDKEGKFHRLVEVFNLKTETFEGEEVLLPNPLRRAVTAVAVDKKIIILGGISQGGQHFSLIDAVTEYNTETGQWSELEPLPFATFAPAAGVIGKDIYLFGGMYIYGRHHFDYVNHIYKYRNQDHMWQHTGRFLKESKGFSKVVTLPGFQLGILGGHSYLGGDAPVDSFEYFKIN